MDDRRDHPPEPDEATLEWARQVSREVLDAHAAGRPLLLPGNPASPASWQQRPMSKQQADLLAQLAGSVPEPDPADLEARVRAVLREPIGLAESALPQWNDVPPGCCRYCHQPAGEEKVCWYCRALLTTHRPAPARVSRLPRVLRPHIIPALIIIVGIIVEIAVLALVHTFG
jgi:hypothetical protein